MAHFYCSSILNFGKTSAYNFFSIIGNIFNRHKDDYIPKEIRAQQANEPVKIEIDEQIISQMKSNEIMEEPKSEENTFTPNQPLEEIKTDEKEKK